MRIALIALFVGWFGALAQDWKPLFDGKSLAGWKATGFGGAGEVEVSDGALVLNMGMLTGVNYTNPVPNVDYEVEFEARRVVGSDFFVGLTFPVRDSFATLIVGGWGGSTIGISSLDGNDAAHNETTSYRRFEAGRWYKFRLSVTTTNLTLELEGERVINADIRGKKISLRPGDIELSKPFGFASYGTTAELREIRLRKLATAPSAAAAVPPQAAGATEALPLPDSLVAGLDRLVTAATNSTTGYLRLAELCDRFGPRFSGTTNLEAAIDWVLAQMRADGLDAVRGEPVTVPHWHRGAESVELLAPTTERLPLLGLGGSVGTPPAGLTAPVLVVTNFSELSNRVAEARGRIVVFDTPYTEYGETVRIRSSGAVEAAKAGAIASLIRSVTPFSQRTPHTGAMQYDTNFPAIPHAALAAEDAARLGRWQARGVTPVLRLTMGAETLPPATSRNVLAELRGREHPDEIVVVGGHIDSWDISQGAQDNAGGCIAAWEGVRLLKELGLRPRRTVRVVLWTNEENGTAGAKAYREEHQAELARHVAALETDSGTFAPAGFGFTGSGAAWPFMRGVAAFLGTRLEAGDLKAGGGGTDLQPLLAAGVPTLGLLLKPNRYYWFHHSDADTVDKIALADLQRCTAAVATMVYALAEAETPLPR